LIKLLLSGKQLLLFIIIAWSILAFVSFNVLTAEASTESGDCSAITEPDDSIYCDEFDWSAFHPDREFVDGLCDASEDYAKNPKNCDKAYDLVEEKEKEQEKEEDEGKRYVNPDGGAPLYEDELTEEEKDDYTEYKPEKEEEQQQIEDWQNEVEPVQKDFEASPKFTYTNEEEEEKHQKEIKEFNEAQDEDTESDDSSGVEEEDVSEEEQDEPEEEEQDEPEEEEEESEE
jgi:hypothetical protein